MPDLSDIRQRFVVDSSGAVRALDEAAQRLEGVGQSADRASSGFSRLERATIVAAQALTLATSAWHAISNAISATIGAAAEQERQDMRLAATLRALGQYSREYFDELEALANNIQRTTVLTDDHALAIQRVLIMLGAQRRDVPLLTRVVLDLASAYDTTAESMAEIIGAALQGRVQLAARTLRLAVEEGASAQQVWAAIIERWRRVAGLAEADARTFAGSVTQLGNAVSEVVEHFGDVFVRSEALREVMRSMTGRLLEFAERVTEVVQKNRAAIDRAFASLGRDALASLDALLADLPGTFDRVASAAVSAAQQIASAWRALRSIIDDVRTVLDAIKGAAVGAALGSLIPFVGTGMGAIAGGAANVIRGKISRALSSEQEIAAALSAPAQEAPRLIAMRPITSVDIERQQAIQEIARPRKEEEASARAVEEAARLAAIRIPELKKIKEEQREADRVITGLLEGERLRIEALQVVARAELDRAKMALDAARQAGDPEEEARAREQVARAIESVVAAEREALQAERDRAAELYTIGRLIPGVFDADQLDAFLARMELMDTKLSLLPQRTEELRRSLLEVRAAAFDVFDALSQNVARAAQQAIAGGARADVGDVIRGTITLTLSDIVGESLRGVFDQLRRAPSALMRVGGSLAAGIASGLLGFGLQGALAGRDPLLLAAAASLLSGGAMLGGTAATVTGASALASALGISTATLGAAAGGLGILALAARPFLLGRGEGTLRLTGEPTSTALGTVAGGASGAAIGLLAGPIGAIVGGAIGAIFGGVMGAFGLGRRTQEDIVLRGIEQIMQRAGLPRRVVFATDTGEIREGVRLADTVIGRDLDRLLGMRDRGNIAPVLAAIERRTPEERAQVREAARPAEIIGRALGLADPQALANTIANLTLALGRGSSEAIEWVKRLKDAAGIDFVGAFRAVHDAFESGKISAEDLRGELDRVTTLFRDDLGPGIDVAAIAMAHLDDAMRSLDLEATIREVNALSAAAKSAQSSIASAVAQLVKSAAEARTADQARSALAQFLAAIGDQLVEIATAKLLIPLSSQIDAIVEAAMQGRDVGLLLSDIFGALADALPGLRAIMDVFRGPQLAQAFRSRADEIRSIIDQINARQDRLRIPELRGDLSRALAQLIAADATTIEQRSDDVVRIAQRLLQVAQAFAPGSVMRLQLEADARRALEVAEQRLRDTADAEERRMEALMRNTSAIERLTDAIERAQQPAIAIVPASDQQPQRVGRMMTGRRV
jgi:hypothetical protein